MMKILEISEQSQDKELLAEYSGYCMICLIANNLDRENSQEDNIRLVKMAFLEYDYGNEHSRQADEYYVKAAQEYLRRTSQR